VYQCTSVIMFFGTLLHCYIATFSWYTSLVKIIPIQTPLIEKDDDLIKLIVDSAQLEDGDIIVLSSKAVAMSEGELIDLSKVEVSDEAKEWAEKLKRHNPNPAFRQAVIDETAHMHGRVLPSCEHAMLTEVRPDGLPSGTILAANAGLDRSNAPDGFAIGWPKDPLVSARRIRKELSDETGKKVAVIITDSCCRPRRKGVTAIALTVAGIDPLQSQIGKDDLFGQDLRMTEEATADQLATAANFVMGNADQSIPAVIIRDHKMDLTDFEGWVPGIEPEEDLFKGML